MFSTNSHSNIITLFLILNGLLAGEGGWRGGGGGVGLVLRWQRNRTGRPLLPHKFIKRTFECWENSRKQQLNAGRGHQAPWKAVHCLQMEVGQNIKYKKTDKRDRDRDPSQEGSLKKDKFPNTRKHSDQRVCGEPWNHRGQHNWEEN